MGSLSTNPRNTISQLKRMMGKKFSDPSVQQDLQYFPFAVTEGPAGECLFNVQYLDKLALFTAEQLMAMLLVDLKDIAAAEGSPVSECVLAVPVYYTEPERNAMLAAAQVRRVGGRAGVGGGWGSGRGPVLQRRAVAAGRLAGLSSVLVHLSPAASTHSALLLPLPRRSPAACRRSRASTACGC